MTAVIFMNQNWIPMSKKEMADQGFKQADFILITGDAYVDHPSFGAALIARTLERFGYKVGIIAQPDMKNDDDFLKLGTPRLAFLVTAGNIDSMVNHYTVNKKRRSKDAYTPGGANHLRPDRATIRYSKKVKQLFGDIPLIIGGIEASLRRLAHYDYWIDALRKSVLLDSGADLLIYGMAEESMIEVADSLNSGLDVKDIIFIRGTVWKTKDEAYLPSDGIHLPSYDDLLDDKEAYNQSFKIQHQNSDALSAKPLIESYKRHYIVQNPASLPLSQNALDDVYDLPFTRKPHPVYQEAIPALSEVKFSLIANRGCFGGCHFCALTHHQGRVIQSRSKASLLKEAKTIINDKDFKGYIHDVGGPTANFYQKACKKQVKKGACTHKDCIGYVACDKLEVSHSDYLDILRSLRNLDGVKKVFVRSGLRYDYMLKDKDNTFFKELVTHHISGQLKVAPEHISDDVLKQMNKPSSGVYDQFIGQFKTYNKLAGKQQFLVPYLMSSHPGSTLESAIELAQYLKKTNQHPEQVQDFYPTPSTASTCMFYTGKNPLTNELVYIPRHKEEKAMQRALMQFKNPKNHALVKKALKKANRYDLIGNHPNALIKH